MRKRPPSLRGFYTMDNYASYALNARPPIGTSMADAGIHNATQTFSYRVLPDIDEDALVVECADDDVAARVSETLFSRSSRLDLWDQPNMAMELRSWVTGMMTFHDVYVHFVLDRADEQHPWTLTFVGWLPPETVVVRGRGAHARYEQYVSKRWPEGRSIVVSGGTREFLEVFTGDEILHLRWPLDQPSERLAPERAARRAGGPVDRYAERLLAGARAGAEPHETFLPIARGRAGAYAGSLDSEKLYDAVVGDRLFKPPEDEITEYFYVDRLVRARIAACDVRDYVLVQLSEQLLGRWARLNGWPRIRLRLRRECWTVHDWEAIRDEYRSADATLDDVMAADRLEWESARFRRSAPRE